MTALSISEVLALLAEFLEADCAQDAAEVTLRQEGGSTAGELHRAMGRRLLAADALSALDAPHLHQLARQAREAEAVREKAALWDGLMSMARIRPLGWAGMDGRTGEPKELDNYGNPNNGYAHLGLELWTIYPDFSDHSVEVTSHDRGKALLTTMARLSAALAPVEVGHE